MLKLNNSFFGDLLEDYLRTNNPILKNALYKLKNGNSEDII
jgi:hypothetical protein